MDSILDSVKTLLGIEVNIVEDPSGEEYDDGDTNFDQELIMHINSVFSILNQLGGGSSDGFRITSREDLWTDFFSDEDAELIKSYMYLKIRLMFDPPQNAFLVKSIEDQVKEFEWRLQVIFEPYALIAEAELEEEEE
jgi:hypothetical protein